MKRGTLRTRSDSERHLVGFLVGEVRYAIGVEHVLQVVNPMPITALPHMPRAILGVAEHRGMVIPVVDMRLHFDLSPADSLHPKWILLLVDGKVMGLVVDAVLGVFRATSEDVRPAPELGSGDMQRGLFGVVSVEGHLVFLLDGVLLHDLAKPALGAVLPKASLETKEDRDSR